MKFIFGTILVIIMCFFSNSIYGGTDKMITDVYPDKGIYKPGGKATITVELISKESFNGFITFSVKDLARELVRENYKLILSPGSSKFSFEWITPGEEKGFGVDVAIFDNNGKMIDTKSTAIDTASFWGKAPRYGFMSDFSPGLTDIEERVKELVKFHIDGLQFYDWMYRHDTYIPVQNIFEDPLGRILSLDTIRKKINFSWSYGITPMAYTAIYAASKEFMEAHKEWGLFKDMDLKEIYDFGNGFLYIMNPSLGTPWTLHMIEEYKKIISLLGFGGIHIDQYGDPKFGYGKDADGKIIPIDLSQVIPEFINATKNSITTINPTSTVTFNCVTSWPIDEVARSKEDFEYIEVWPPYKNFDDFYTLINNARTLNGGRQIVIAAYVDTILPTNILLTDAIVFASGGYRIELGEERGYLVDPYFPKYKLVSQELYRKLRKYYDFITRYRIFLYDSQLVPAEGISTDKDVWAIRRSLSNYEVIHFINYNRALMDRWNEPLFKGIKEKKYLRVNLSRVQEPKAIYLISPDIEDPRPLALNFTYSNGLVSLNIPSLYIWDTLVIEWK